MTFDEPDWRGDQHQDTNIPFIRIPKGCHYVVGPIPEEWPTRRSEDCVSESNLSLTFPMPVASREAVPIRCTEEQLHRRRDVQLQFLFSDRSMKKLASKESRVVRSCRRLARAVRSFVHMLRMVPCLVVSKCVWKWNSSIER